MPRGNKTVKAEIDIFLLLRLKFDVKEMRISFFHIKAAQMFFLKVALKNFSIFTREHLCWSLFLIKLHAWKPASLLRTNSNTSVFPVTFRHITVGCFCTLNGWIFYMSTNCNCNVAQSRTNAQIREDCVSKAQRKVNMKH